MKTLVFSKDLKPLGGTWNTNPDIVVSNICRKIYSTPKEPSCKEQFGDLKLSFVEASSDKVVCPPTYNFNSENIQNYPHTSEGASHPFS